MFNLSVKCLGMDNRMFSNKINSLCSIPEHFRVCQDSFGLETVLMDEESNSSDSWAAYDGGYDDRVMSSAEISASNIRCAPGAMGWHSGHISGKTSYSTFHGGAPINGGAKAHGLSMRHKRKEAPGVQSRGKKHRKQLSSISAKGVEVMGASRIDPKSSLPSLSLALESYGGVATGFGCDESVRVMSNENNELELPAATLQDYIVYPNPNPTAFGSGILWHFRTSPQY